MALSRMYIDQFQMEHAFGEWRDGTFRRADFKDDAAVRYFHHLAGLQHVERHAPKYMATIQANIFKAMLYVLLSLGVSVY